MCPAAWGSEQTSSRHSPTITLEMMISVKSRFVLATALVVVLALATSSDGMYLPNYGNYCGKKRSSGTCKDKLDCLCKEHDRCYKKYGENTCKCDSTFVNGVRAISHTSQIFGKTRRKAFAEALRMSTCRGPKRVQTGSYIKNYNHCRWVTPNWFRPKHKKYKCTQKRKRCRRYACQMKTLWSYHDKETVGHTCSSGGRIAAAMGDGWRGLFGTSC